MNVDSFFRELRQRNVIKAAITYAAVSWFLLQAGSIVFPALDFSDVAMRYLLIVLLVLFPPWLVFSWAYEYTPEGFKKTEEVLKEKSVSDETGRRLNTVIIFTLSLVVMLLIADRLFNLTGAILDGVNDKSIAVLPFENKSGDDDAYFADGITEDILTQISKVGGLRVLSRFTLKEYDTAGKTPKQIRKELKVAYILVGSIRRAGEALRIGCQLIDTESELETWAQNFDRRITDVFTVQSEIAQMIASNLKVQLSTEEKERIEKEHTDNLSAYNYYLQAKASFNISNLEDNETAILLSLKAIEEDPGFSMAYSLLANAYFKSIFNYGTRPESFLDSTLVISKKALSLDPSSSEALAQIAYYYAVRGDNTLAMNYAQQAINNNANNAFANNMLGLLYRISGHIDMAIPLFKNTASRDLSRIDVYYYNLGTCYQILGLYPQALSYYNSVLELRKAQSITLVQVAEVHILSGMYDEAKKTIHTILSQNENVFTWNEAGRLMLYIDEKEEAKNYFRKSMDHADFEILSYPESLIGLANIWMQEGKTDSAHMLLDRVYSVLIDEYGEDSDHYEVLWNLASVQALRGNSTSLDYIKKMVEAGFLKSRLARLDTNLSGLWENPEFQSSMNQVENKVVLMRNKVIKMDMQ